MCRNRAVRDRASAAAEAKAEARKGDAEHSLVTATRAELTKAKVLDTVDGQIAMVLARRAAEANAAGVSTLVKGLREAIAAAKADQPQPTPTGPEPPPEPPTALEEARAKRDAKARQAADRT